LHQLRERERQITRLGNYLCKKSICNQKVKFLSAKTKKSYLKFAKFNAYSPKKVCKKLGHFCNYWTRDKRCSEHCNFYVIVWFRFSLICIFDTLFVVGTNQSQTPTVNKILHTYRVCHGFRLKKPDNYFRVSFDHFWSNRHLLRQLGQYRKLAWI